VEWLLTKKRNKDEKKSPCGKGKQKTPTIAGALWIGLVSMKKID
jgi:hypothetical protein